MVLKSSINLLEKPSHPGPESMCSLGQTSMRKAPKNIEFEFPFGSQRSCEMFQDFTEHSPQWFPQHDVRGMKDTSSHHNTYISISWASTLCATYTRLCCFVRWHRYRQAPQWQLQREKKFGEMSQCGFWRGRFTESGADSILQHIWGSVFCGVQRRHTWMNRHIFC